VVWCGVSHGVSAGAFPSCGQGAGGADLLWLGNLGRVESRDKAKTDQSYREGRNWSDLLHWVVSGTCL